MAGRKFIDQTPDADKAKALYELTIKHIRKRLESVPEWTQQAKAQAIAENPSLKGKPWSKVKEYLNATDNPLYRKTQDLQGELKTLNRSLGELLTTDAELFLEKGLFNALQKDNLNSKELTKTLKSFDNKMSGAKLGKAFHHQHLSSLRPLLENASKDWVKEFNAIAADHGYQLGDRGLIGIDPLAHKPFDTFAGKSDRWKVRGILEKYFPQGVSKTKPSKARDLINLIADSSSHGSWAGGTKGFTIADKLSDLSPEEAFKASRSILDVEKVIADQGLKLDKLLENWDANMSKYPDLDTAIDDLTNKVKRRTPPNIKSLLDDAAESTSKALMKPTTGRLLGGVKDTLKIAKKGRHLLGPASLAITGLAANQQIAAAQENPSARNIALAGGRSLEAGLDTFAAGAAATGIGLPVAAVAEGASIATGLATDLGEYMTSDEYKNRGVIRGRSGAKRALDPVTQNQADLALNGF